MTEETAAGAAPELTEWLRGQVVARLELARKASPDDGPAHWCVDHHRCEVWLYCDDPCEEAAECAADACRHTSVTGDNIKIYAEGGHDEWQAAHIASNDPQDTVARCEAELAILDEHPPIPLSETHDGCKTCVTWHDDEGMHEFGIAVSEPWPCRTVRLLASGYRYRPGYQEEWKP